MKPEFEIYREFLQQSYQHLGGLASELLSLEKHEDEIAALQIDIDKFREVAVAAEKKSRSDARDAHLYIKSSSETCSIINETKIIDLRPLTSVEQRDAEVVLNIGGWRTKMTYVYIPQ